MECRKKREKMWFRQIDYCLLLTKAAMIIIVYLWKKYISSLKHPHRDSETVNQAIIQAIAPFLQVNFFHTHLWLWTDNWEYDHNTIFRDLCVLDVLYLLFVLTVRIAYYIAITLILWVKKLSFSEVKCFR